MKVVATFRQRKVDPWRWNELLAVSYLLLFLAVAILVPATGLMQNPYDNTNSGPTDQPPLTVFSQPSSNSSTFYWLGTDGLGQDVLAHLIYGARTALIVSLPAMLLATILGVLLGSIAGFWGNSGIRVPVLSFIISCALLLIGIFYAFHVRQVNWAQAFTKGSLDIITELGRALLLFLSLGILGWLLTLFFKKIGFRKQITLPVDQIILRLIEVVGAIPRLLLVMCLVAFVESSLVNVILLAALTYWTSIARLVRGELRQIKELPYIEAARVAGLPDTRILWKQALPNALPPIIVAVAFGLGNLISLEATLSYLGIGIPIDKASWGKIIKGITQNYDAWWLVVFPTLALGFTVVSLQIVANRVLKQITPSRPNL